MILYHISENPNIQRFNPRPILNQNCEIVGNAVWAIDEDHLANYLLPRDCPRLVFFKNNNSTKADIEKFSGNSSADRIIAVESFWGSQIFEQNLFQYEFDDSQFSCIDESAGYFISRDTVNPIKATCISNGLLRILSTNTEFRIMPSLWKLREDVINSSLGYSIIRMRNAQLPPEGIDRFHPLPQ